MCAGTWDHFNLLFSAETRHNRLVPRRRRSHANEEYARFEQTFVIGKFRGIQSKCVVSGAHTELPVGNHRPAHNVERAFRNRSRRLHGSRFDHCFKSVRSSFS